MGTSIAPERSLTRRARHVAIISDGNARWAGARGLSITEGHNAGADTLKARLRDAVELGVEQLTVYAFSTENWLRPIEEVRGLISVLAERIAAEAPALHRHGVRMRFIGRRDGVAAELVEAMARAEALTGQNRLITLFMAVNYGGRAEILDAALRMRSEPDVEFRASLYAPDMQDPDLIIRTGGERRLSNFLLWQSAYSELVFSDVLWPDFAREHLERALADFAVRQRRFGGR
jgi:undecaprenyl diphosphate synthase